MGCRQLITIGICNDEEIRFPNRRKYRDSGVTGLVLCILCYFRYDDDRIHNIAEFLIDQQNTEGSWFYDILAALDYLRDIDIKDQRLSAAIEELVKKQNTDNTWNLQNKHAGTVFFEMEKAGGPSRWNTLRGSRVLNWWQE